MSLFCSIIMPVYNRAAVLPLAINSVLAQTYPHWELIIIDDCSQDDSKDVALSFNDLRVRVLQTQRNGGAAAARNLGIKDSNGQLISFLDSDDAYEPDFLEESLKKIETLSPDVGLIWTGLRYLRQEKGVIIKKESIWKPAIQEPYKLFLSDLRIGTNSGITIRRKVFDTIGLFDESLPAAEDTDLFLRISKSYKVGFVDKVLINIHQVGDDRLSRRFDKIARAYRIILPKHLDAIRQEKLLRLKYFYKVMWLNYHLGDDNTARYYFKLVLKDQFLFMKAWMIFLIFELFGNKNGAKLHTLVSRIT